MDTSNQPKLAKVEKIIGRTGSRGGVIQVSRDYLIVLYMFVRFVSFSPIMTDSESVLSLETSKDP